MGFLTDLAEYRALRLRRLALRKPLERRAAERLEELERRYGAAGTGGFDSRRRFRRFDVRLRGMIEDTSGLRWIETVNVSGGGLSITPAPSLRRGEIAHVELWENGQTVRFAVQAVWSTASPDTSETGLAFVGVPVVDTDAALARAV